MRRFKILLVIVLLTVWIHPAMVYAAESAIGARIEGEKKAEAGWAVTPHRRNYLLPYTYNWNPNNDSLALLDPDAPNFENSEAKFQISFKAPVWENIFDSTADIYFAYTQISLWQIFYDQSAPFRDTNYEPEFFVAFNTGYNLLGLNNRAILLGFVHQSNGRGHGLLSRSWNRLYGTAVLERGNLGLTLKAWYRLPEDSKDDDNPNIEKYYGYGELRAAYKWGEQVWSVLLRNNLRTENNKGAIELGWSFPLSDKLRGYVQYFNGYGESLLDYDHRNNRLGVGFMLNDWI